MDQQAACLSLRIHVSLDLHEKALSNLITLSRFLNSLNPSNYFSKHAN